MRRCVRSVRPSFLLAPLAFAIHVRSRPCRRCRPRARGDRRDRPAPFREHPERAHFHRRGNRRDAREKGHRHARRALAADAQPDHAGRWTRVLGGDARPRQPGARHRRELGRYLYRRGLFRAQPPVAQPDVRHGSHRGAARPAGHAVRTQHHRRRDQHVHRAALGRIQRARARRVRQHRFAQARRLRVRPGHRHAVGPHRGDQQRARHLHGQHHRPRWRRTGQRGLSRQPRLDPDRDGVRVRQVRAHDAREHRHVRPAGLRSLRRVGRLSGHRPEAGRQAAGERPGAAGAHRARGPLRRRYRGDSRQLGPPGRLRAEIGHRLERVRRALARLDLRLAGQRAHDQRPDRAQRVLQPGAAHRVAHRPAFPLRGRRLRRQLRRPHAAARGGLRRAQPRHPDPAQPGRGPGDQPPARVPRRPAGQRRAGLCQRHRRVLPPDHALGLARRAHQQPRPGNQDLVAVLRGRVRVHRAVAPDTRRALHRRGKRVRALQGHLVHGTASACHGAPTRPPTRSPRARSRRTLRWRRGPACCR